MATKSKKKPIKPKPYVPTAAEKEQDPSLKYFQYKPNEEVWSDELNLYVRFLAYAGPGRVRLGRHSTGQELPGVYDALQVRRPRAGVGTPALEWAEQVRREKELVTKLEGGK